MIDLLKKWLNGTARATDEQKLEAQAREDDFLADALEGYRSKPEGDHSKNIAALKDQLRAKNKDRSRIIVWWRIAAAAALIGVVGTWLFVGQDAGRSNIAAKDEVREELIEPSAAPEEPIARTRVAPPAEAEPEVDEEQQELADAESQSGSANPPQVGPDSYRETREKEKISAAESSQETPASDETQQTYAIQKEVMADEAIAPDDTVAEFLIAEDQALQPTIAMTPDKNVLDSNSRNLEGNKEAGLVISSTKMQPEVKVEESVAAPPPRAFSQTENLSAKKREAPPAEKFNDAVNALTLRGSILDETSDEPLIGASVSIKGTADGALTDFDGRFEIQSNQALPWVLVLNYTGFSSQEVRVERVEEELVLRMEEGQLLLDEVVVTGYSQGPKIIDVEPKPRGGWKKFERYVRDNLQYPETTKAQELEGEVSLEFYINKKGSPEQIIILNSFCDPCSEEAIRLLRDGPKWRGKEKRTTVSIPFEL